MVIAGYLTLSPSQRNALASPELGDLDRAVVRDLSVISRPWWAFWTVNDVGAFSA